MNATTPMIPQANPGAGYLAQKAEIDAAVTEPETRAKIADLGGMPPGLTADGGTSPAAFEAFIKAEIVKWTEVVRKSGATAE